MAEAVRAASAADVAVSVRSARRQVGCAVVLGDIVVDLSGRLEVMCPCGLVGEAVGADPAGRCPDRGSRTRRFGKPGARTPRPRQARAWAVSPFGRCFPRRALPTLTW
ncbi:hypothetical protein Shyhy01_24000 [Streptomyces hygroscopicus subsp. hygroscopicus]|nr:hypothetical protein Shyhy01_24000 [Streptomyces hygroscopicus subsp. hygroscopicus]